MNRWEAFLTSPAGLLTFVSTMITVVLFLQTREQAKALNSTESQGDPNPAYRPTSAATALAWTNTMTNEPVAIPDQSVPLDSDQGGFFADTFRHPEGYNTTYIPTSNQSTEQSGAIQSWSARPFQQGNNAAYADAYMSSPPDPSYTANVLVQDPTANIAGN